MDKSYATPVPARPPGQLSDRARTLSAQPAVGSPSQKRLYQVAADLGLGNQAALRLMEAHQDSEQALAQEALQGAGRPYPFREEIARSGGHDLSALQAFTTPAARFAAEILGGEGFYFDGKVGFAGEPTMDVAMHEAGHHIAGHRGVRLDNGELGGQTAEQEADAAATACDQLKAEIDRTELSNRITVLCSRIRMDTGRYLRSVREQFEERGAEIPEERSFRQAAVEASFDVASGVLGMVFEGAVTQAGRSIDAAVDGNIYSKTLLKKITATSITAHLKRDIISRMAQFGEIDSTTLASDSMIREFFEAYEEGLCVSFDDEHDRFSEAEAPELRSYIIALEHKKATLEGAVKRSGVEAFLEVAARATANKRDPDAGGDINNEVYSVEVLVGESDQGFAEIRLPSAVPQGLRAPFLEEGTLQGRRLLLVKDGFLKRLFPADHSLMEYDIASDQMLGVPRTKPDLSLTSFVAQHLPERADEFRSAIRCASHLHQRPPQSPIAEATDSAIEAIAERVWDGEIGTALLGERDREVEIERGPTTIPTAYRPDTDAAFIVQEIVGEAMRRWCRKSIDQIGGVGVTFDAMQIRTVWSD
ncbi:MAG: hypothetical protein AAFV53_07170 [Myxococcota bacterium]